MFLFLGRLIVLDHLEGLGYAGAIANALVDRGSLNRLMHQALAFNVWTEPGITSTRKQ